MKFLNITLSVLALSLISFAPAKKSPKVMSGDSSFLKKSSTVYVEFDISEASIDGLDSEADFIEYKRKKEKSRSEADKWEKAWNKDKEDFGEYYGEVLRKATKKYPASFNIDDPESDYKMVVQPIHIETGTPIKYSSIETKLIFTEIASGEEVAVIYIPASRGLQMGPMSPTTGYRVKAAAAGSAKMIAKFYKKLLK
ncbi:MAG: hypothetical protein N4A46_01225 [Schleiferiaceae bacterium]|nr:hypothetical protein [Schleiferiaceae bacterium]